MTTLPAGFTIDTQLSPDRVRVQWPATAAPGASTLPNLGMEAGDVNWLKGAGWEISTGGLVDTGSWSAKYSGIGQSSVFHEQAVPVTPGTTITATARVSKGNTRNDFAGGGISMLWLDESLAVVGIANGGTLVNSGGPEFQTSSITGTAPAGAAYVRLFFDATRDVKGRASDKVYVDNIAWNHTFALGGTGGGSTAPTGPKTFTFRVRDANGCTAVATRTIGQGPSSTGTWILFGRPQGSSAADQYSVASAVPSAFTGSARSAVVGGIGFDVSISGHGGGWLFASSQSGATNAIRSSDLGNSWSTTQFSGLTSQQRIDVRGGRVIAAQPSAVQYSDDFGVSVTTSGGSAMQERYLFDTLEAVGSPRSTSDILQTTDNFSSRTTISGFPVWGSSRNAVNLCAGTTHLVMAGASNSPANRFSRVPLSNPRAAHTPFTVAAVSSSATWNSVFPSIAYGNSIFVMVTDQGQIVRSTDEGASWTVSSFTFTSPRSLVFGDGVFMIVGNAGAIYTSTNGDTWTLVPSGTFGTDNITNAIFVPN